MKAARLVSEIVILGARSRPITASDLAGRLEVTERTIYRDLGELSRMGVPVITEAGPGGGISLLGEWVSPVAGLTRDELDSLLIGSPAAADLGFSSTLATARAKVLTESSSAFSQLILVDGPDWFMAEENPEQLDTIVTALRTQRGLQVTYRGRNGLRSRALLPLGLVVKAGRWYLAAQPPGGSPRTYRVSRIGSAELRFLHCTPPSSFDLAGYWTRALAEFDASIRRTLVRLRLPVAQIDDLLRAIPGRLTEDAVNTGRTDRDTLEIDIPMEPDEVAVSQLVTVPGVEVLSPKQLRRDLHDHARAAAELNE
ncbi:WYL domain-containing protein [Brevibacterium permense]|uniref:helix-turn-helix transcriptional regulator n=1 Tax=Brevibacterium permense TaxID=234834 RepID=UPI0021D37A8D|nr:WYL domain-containing protein [Brevibacterium permense]MCU4296952.1 WYL domain-containing protein [Brevibacterium permense]